MSKKVFDWYGTTLKATYLYDATGQRIGKKIPTANAGETFTTYYPRGAGGQLQGMYQYTQALNGGGSNGTTDLQEIPIYGAGRIGVAYYQSNAFVFHYELADHLGNVRAVIYRNIRQEKQVVKYADYYPLGWEMPGRVGQAWNYRYGYQGQFAEKDEETGWNAFELRSYDGRVGRWMTIDPMEEFWSPYVSMGNRPHMVTDPTGGETDTWYVNNDDPSQRVWVNDGIDRTIYVSATAFEQAQYFSLVIDVNSIHLNDLVDAYTGFYNEHSSYDEFNIGNFIDYFFGGPNLRPALIGGAGSLEFVGGYGAKGGKAILNGVNSAAKTSTDFVSNVTATSFGKVWGQGTVNVGKTINAIRSGSLKPAGVYNNIEKHAQLLGKPNGYWQKYELLDYGSKAPLRIIKGGNGELFLTPDHYKSLIPLGGL